MDQDELRRKNRGVPRTRAAEVSGRARIAEVLGRRLFGYIRQPPAVSPPGSTTLDSLLPQGAVLFFSAGWDGNSERYRHVVMGIAATMGRQMIEIDVDDVVGGAIPSAYRVLNTPAVVVGAPGRATIVLGQLDAKELERRISR